MFWSAESMAVVSRSSADVFSQDCSDIFVCTNAFEFGEALNFWKNQTTCFFMNGDSLVLFATQLTSSLWKCAEQVSESVTSETHSPFFFHFVRILLLSIILRISTTVALLGISVYSIAISRPFFGVGPTGSVLIS